MDNSPIAITIHEGQLEPGQYSKCLEIDQETTCMFLNVVGNNEGSVWLSDGSEKATEICIAHDGIQFRHADHSEVPEKDAELTVTKNTDNGTNFGLRLRIEWAENPDGVVISVIGLKVDGEALEPFENYQLDHRVTFFFVGHQEHSNTYQIILANQLKVGWVPAGWGLHPSTATQFTKDQKNETSDSEEYVCIGRSQHTQNWEVVTIPGQLMPKEKHSYVYGSEIFFSGVYEVLCNVRTEWRQHEPGDSIDENLAIMADSRSDPAICIGLVSTDDGDKIIGKVEHRDDSSDYVCHYFFEEEARFTDEYEYLVT